MTPESSAARLARADAIYRFRRQRARMLPALTAQFGEPAWDMVLDLYVAGGRGRPVSVSDACIAAAVPATTGLRALARLEQLDLVVRSGDPADARRSFVAVSEELRTAMDRLLESWG